MVNKILANIKHNLENNVDKEIAININKKLEIISEYEKPSVFIEMVDNLDLLITSLNSSNVNKLKSKIDNKSIEDKLNIFFEELNTYSTFHKLDSNLQFNTADSGIPDTSIVNITNNEYQLICSAASNDVKAWFEDIQLLRHPIKLQLSLQRALNELEGKILL